MNKSKEKILIVEDEPDIAIILEEILIREGYECTKIENGIDGLIYLSNNYQNISLILSDITMPDMNGIDMVTSAMHQFGYLPIILITGHSEFKFTQSAVQLGIIDYILKPFDVPSLIKKIPVWIEIGRREMDKFNGLSALGESNKMEILLRLSNMKKLGQ